MERMDGAHGWGAWMGIILRLTGAWDTIAAHSTVASNSTLDHELLNCSEACRRFPLCFRVALAFGEVRWELYRAVGVLPERR
jgi:hypothetical protein